MTGAAHEPLCMYCSTTGSKSPFSDEHIIPQNIGGSWVLSDCVCRQCNNTLGKEVDFQAWRIPDVVSAHDKLKIPYDPNIVFKNHYHRKARMEGHDVPFRAEWTSSGIRIHPYPHQKPDGVKVYPLCDYQEHLKRNLRRKNGYSSSLVEDLFKRIDVAKPGQQIDHPSQNQHFIKGHEEKITLDLIPHDNIIGRLITKVAFEFLYVLTFPYLLEWSAVTEPLKQYSRYGKTDEKIFIRRVKSGRSDFEPFHAITCYLQNGIVLVYVTLFGYIVYELLMRVTPDSSFLNRIRRETERPDLVGFGYEQHIQSQFPSRGLRALLIDDRSLLLDTW